MDISIVIVSYNVRDSLVDCLRSIEEHRNGIDLETFVVDNASADGTAKMVANLFPHVRLIVNAENRGFAAACNQGIAEVSGRHILLLNPDTIVQPAALPAMVAFLDQTDDAGIVGCRILDGNGRKHLSCYPLPSVASVMWQHWQLYRFLPGLFYTSYQRECLESEEPFRVGWVIGACFMVKRQVAEMLAGLDERYFLFVEEVDFCRRAARIGWHTYFLPKASVVHLESRSTSQIVPVKLRSHYISKLQYFAKFEPHYAVILLKVIFLIDLALKMLIRSVGIPFSKPPDAARRVSTYLSIARECAAYATSEHRGSYPE